MTARWPEVPQDFPKAAKVTLQDEQLRANLGHATTAIRAKRGGVVAEVDDWEALRDEGAAARDRALRRLDERLVELEENVRRAGGVVHWAPDKATAQEIVVDLVAATGSDEVIKVKSLLTDELELNPALADAGITAHETDLAELIVQLGGDRQSHILVPAIHRNRREIRDIFREHLPGAEDVEDDPAALAEAARRHLRDTFLRVPVAISGANAAVSATGTVAVVESEGNGRMCLTLPETLITVMGIEKVLETWDDLGTILRLLPRSSTGERMNPYTSLWTGVTEGDGPQAFHLVLVDAGRTNALADPVGRDALRCIRCSACLNVCPVYERTGGQAYESIYPGPIGAILTPQLQGLDTAPTLPWASSLCGACYEVCPVKIDIPRILVHLRGRVTAETDASGKGHHAGVERLAMRSVARVMDSRPAYEAAQRAGRLGLSLLQHGNGRPGRLPGLKGWTASRDLPGPEPSFRSWWRQREAGGDGPSVPEGPPPVAGAPTGDGEGGAGAGAGAAGDARGGTVGRSRGGAAGGARGGTAGRPRGGAASGARGGPAGRPRGGAASGARGGTADGSRGEMPDGGAGSGSADGSRSEMPGGGTGSGSADGTRGEMPDGVTGSGSADGSRSEMPGGGAGSGSADGTRPGGGHPPDDAGRIDVVVHPPGGPRARGVEPTGEGA